MNLVTLKMSHVQNIVCFVTPVTGVVWYARGSGFMEVREACVGSSIDTLSLHMPLLTRGLVVIDRLIALLVRYPPPIPVHSSRQWRSQGGGATGHLPPPPLGLRQVLGRECTHQADQGENGNLQ